MKVLVGSTNPVKLNAVKESFALYFEDIIIEGISVNSGVPAQPVNSQTFEGAKNRALELKKVNSEKNLSADFFVGIEGGIKEAYGKWFAFGCMCIMKEDGKFSFGTSAHFELPDIVTKRLLNGEELGFVMDEIMQEKNTKQNPLTRQIPGSKSFFSWVIPIQRNRFTKQLTKFHFSIKMLSSKYKKLQ